LSSDQQLMQVSGTCEGWECTAPVDSEYLQIVPLPELARSYSTCLKISGNHYHAELVSSSELLPPSKGLILKSTKGTDLRVPHLVKAILGTKQVAVRMIQSIPTAKQVVISMVKGYGDFDLSECLPPVVWKSMKFPVVSEKAYHNLYGTVFSKTRTLIVSEVEGETHSEFFKVDSSTKIHQGEVVSSKGVAHSHKLLNAYSSVFKTKAFRKALLELKKYSTLEQSPMLVNLKAPRGCGKRAVVAQTAQSLGYNFQEASFYDLCNLSQISKTLEATKEILPVVLHLRQFSESLGLFTYGQPHVIKSLKKLLVSFAQDTLTQSFVLVVSTSLNKPLPGIIRNLFIEVNLQPPDEEDRNSIVSYLCPQLDPISLAKQTPGKSVEELIEITSQVSAGKNLQKILSSHKSASIPNVKWEDVGGLTQAKEDIIDTIQLPLKHPELFSSGVRSRSGLLLYGPPGTGKTLLAKAVATECQLNFLAVKGPELLNSYIGESERNIRELFEKARNSQPCVLFFDELDALAPARGSGGDSGGVMDRIVAQLLSELDSLQSSKNLFVIGASNRPDLLDPALLRPGRFDKMIFLGVPSDQESQLKILEALTRKFSFPSDFDLAQVAQKCSNNMTGADFYSLCSTALSNAYQEKALQLEAQEEPCLEKPKVTMRHFDQALESFTPSLSQTELKKYQDMQYKLSQKK